MSRRGGAGQLRSNASDKENRRRGRGRVDDRRRRCLKIGNDGAAAPFLQLALPSFRRSLALGNVAKGRSTEQVGLLPDALHRGNVARFADAMAGHARSPQKAKAVRSEEHTSELQSLMRISYAVFCLKKKINTKAHR